MSAVTVTQANYLFSPSTPTVASGESITVKNTTPSTPHTFTVTGEDIDVTLDPASSQEVAIDLPPGTYPFICRFHEASGMTGTLTVT
jgi:plastocyanin